MKLHKKNFEEFVKELGGNNRIFSDRVKDIANAYIKAGGMAVAISAAPVTLTGSFIIDAVKEFFSNGDTGNSDDFGFKNPAAGADQVMDAFAELKTGLQQVAQDAINKIKAINAFGNTNVGLNLAQSAGAIVGILNDHIAKAEQQIKQSVGETAAGYTKIGSSAETSAKISAN